MWQNVILSQEEKGGNKLQQKMSQNIFQYATSELSQDAFICLIIAWFDSDNKKLKEISQDFINWSYAKPKKVL